MTRAAIFCVSALTAFLALFLPTTIVASDAAKEEVRQIIEFVQGGRETTPMLGGFAAGLGITKNPEGPSLPAINKSFRVGDSVHTFSIVTANGRREFIAQRFRGDFYQGWRMNEDGMVINTVQVDDNQKVTKREGLIFESDFASVMATLLEKAKAATKRD